jgi:hypothetical protein
MELLLAWLALASLPTIRFLSQQRRIPYRLFDKDQRLKHAAIIENKRLSNVLAYIKQRQDQQVKPKVKTNSEKNGYKPRGRNRAGRRTT